MTWSQKASWTFLGLLYVVAGLAILRWPEMLYYAVAAIFFVQGVVSLIRVFTQ